MSLKDLAQQMKATGRKGDTELIHMTKREVAGLQALAEAAGGTLTKNPKTGLPEASFLENLLPTILGIGLTPFLGPMGAGLAVGGLETLRTGDIGKGALAGFGAFGGANLAAGLSSTGATAAQAAATPGAQAAGQAAVDQATKDFAARQAMAEGAKVSGAEAAQMAIQGQVMPTIDLTAPNLDVIRNQAMGDVYRAATPQGYAAIGQGIQSLGDAGGRELFMQNVGGLGGLAKTGAMAAAPMIVGGMMPRGGSAEMPGEKEDTEDLMGRYEYRANPTGGIRTPGSAFTGERVYFQPEYRRMFAAKGGEVKKFADGGEAAAPSSAVTADAGAFDPARGMTGMSRDAMMYLYGLSEGSRGNVPEAVTDYVAPEVRFNVSRMAPGSSGGGMGGGIGGIRGGFGGGFGGEGGIDVNPNIDFGYFSGMTPNVNYGIPVVDRMDYTGMGGGAGGGFGFGGVSASDTGNLGFGGGSLGGFASDGASSADSGPSEGADGSPGGGYADGGIASLARGGMKAGGFVVPADVVSMVGEGNTDAGYERIKRMLPGATPIKGKDGGQADTVKTSIEGKQPARIAHGEMYVPPAAVKRAGGAKKLYAMMDKVRKQATGNKKQIKPVNLKKAMA
jgi:hypothetical protein